MRAIVAGSIDWSNREAIRRELSKLPPGTTVVHGDCAGADNLGGAIARELGLRVEPMAKNEQDREKFPRDSWKGLNERMLASGADLVLVFHPKIADSDGSKHLADLARAVNIEVRVCDGCSD